MSPWFREDTYCERTLDLDTPGNVLSITALKVLAVQDISVWIWKPLDMNYNLPLEELRLDGVRCVGIG